MFFFWRWFVWGSRFITHLYSLLPKNYWTWAQNTNWSQTFPPCSQHVPRAPWAAVPCRYKNGLNNRDTTGMAVVASNTRFRQGRWCPIQWSRTRKRFSPFRDAFIIKVYTVAVELNSSTLTGGWPLGLTPYIPYIIYYIYIIIILIPTEVRQPPKISVREIQMPSSTNN